MQMMVLGGANVFAQSTAPGSGDDASKAEEDSSRKVDESEESYRTRMELRDQRYREQQRADMIYSTQGGTSKLDQLPEASREHIKEQMRDMIIASRQWKPGEDVSDYPYEPSAAAQNDPQLRRHEREAWAEQLQKYQQREAAAYANAQANQQANQNAQAGGEQGGNGSSSAGKGDPNRNSGAAGKNQARSAPNADSYREREQEMEAVSTAGVSENALSFLQGRDGQGQQATLQADGEQAGESDSEAADQSDSPNRTVAAEAQPGSLEVSELKQLKGMSTSGEDTADVFPAAPQAGSPAASTAQQSSSAPGADAGSEQKDEAKTLAGTLGIDELDKLGNESLQALNVAPAGSAIDEPENPAASGSVEAGTLKIEELKRLKDKGDGL